MSGWGWVATATPAVVGMLLFLKIAAEGIRRADAGLRRFERRERRRLEKQPAHSNGAMRSGGSMVRRHRGQVGREDDDGIIVVGRAPLAASPSMGPG